MAETNVSDFAVVPVSDGKMIGGHYAVECWGRMVGRTFRLDKVQADVLKFELERAYEQGRKSK
jgi:hypothetical protein